MFLTFAVAIGGTGAQTPSISLVPSGGPAGSTVHVTGNGFADSSTCGVILYFDDPDEPPLGDSPVSDGTFATDVTIPASAAAGQHVIVVRGQSLQGEFCAPSGEEARAPFLIEGPTSGPFTHGPVIPVVRDIDLSTLPKIVPWREGDPVRVGPGQELPGEEEGAAGTAAAPSSKVSGKVGRRTSRRDERNNPAGRAPTGQHTRGDRRRAVEEHRYVSKLRPTASVLSPPFLAVDGVPATGVLPPDVSGDVGPNHYFQAVNSAFMIFDKQGAVLAGPSDINDLWDMVGGPCETNNDGDPDVRYDPIADRWIIMQFVAFTDFCMAVSQTADPVTGGWFLYDFGTGGATNDYPKIAVWPDAYYAGSQRGYSSSGCDAWAFDRTAMLAGAAATAVSFFDSSTFLLPADLDGATGPPAGAPDVFLRQVDGAQFGGTDRLELREFHVDFATPANSTFTALPDLATAAFDRSLCGLGLTTTCIAQPGTTRTLEAMTAWPLSRLQYRNFGTHETLVVNHGVDADGADHAGVRWYELRDSGAGWTIFQQGTHAPDQGAPGLADDPSRWMASAAMDKNGNLAIGYSVSNSAIFPGLRYAGRLVGDTAGTLPQGETVLVDGAGSQTHSSGRWGDYATLTVDPVDDCTMWFSSEYYATTSTAGWLTRIGSFRLDGTAPVLTCPADTTVECSATGGTPKDDPQLTVFFSGLAVTDDCDLQPTITDDAPAFFPLGDTPVDFAATDANGNVGACLADLTVSDTVAPTIVAPPDVADVECTSPVGTPVVLGSPTVSDVCDAVPVVANDAPALFPPGATDVHWTATDASSNVGTDTQQVDVVDTIPPELSVVLSPTVLWPPNHKMVTITATILVDDVCDATPAVRLVSIVSNEPTNGPGDGNTSPDIAGATFGTDDREFQVRGERSGGGHGRTYVVTYAAEDAAHNVTLREATVVVPHDR